MSLLAGVVLIVWSRSEVGYTGYSGSGGRGEIFLSCVSAAVYSFCQMYSFQNTREIQTIIRCKVMNGFLLGNDEVSGKVCCVPSHLTVALTVYPNKLSNAEISKGSARLQIQDDQTRCRLWYVKGKKEMMEKKARTREPFTGHDVGQSG